MALFFSRNTKVYLQQGTSGTIWEIPVLDGFSFSQSVNSSSVSLTEATKSAAVSKSRRSRRVFNDSYAPAEWSFSTYARPFVSVNGATGGWEDSGSVNQHHAVEEALWANFAGKVDHTQSNGAAESFFTPANTVTSSTSNMIVSFQNSEVAELGEFSLFFVMSGDTNNTYKIHKCCVNEVSIDFDVDGITVINWSGFGSDISDEGTSVPSPDIYEKINATDNFVRNRLTKLTLTANDTAVFAGASGVYTSVLTGGNITLNNNITYLTAETLGRIDKPMGHVTGTREFGGSFTSYLDSTDNSVAELFQELIDNDHVVTNSFSLVFDIGGTSAPNVQVAMPRCHLEIPTHSIEDVISMDVSFQALPADYNPDAADEMEAKVTYTGS